jgi:hypothetical protein
MKLGSSLTAERSGTESASPLKPGVYLTDGTHLFRVTSVTSGSKGPKLVELEDCRTFETSVHDSEALAKLGLATVTPAPHGLGAIS